MAIEDTIGDAQGMQATVYKQRLRRGVAVVILIAVITAGTVGLSAGVGWAAIVFTAVLLAYGFQRLAGDQSATNRVPE